MTARTAIEATITAYLPAAAQGIPANYPAISISRLSTDNISGWLAGRLTIGDEGLGFAMGNESEILYDIDGNGYQSNVDLSEYLPEEVDADEFAEYVSGVLSRIESAMESARSRLVEAFSEQVIAAALA